MSLEPRFSIRRRWVVRFAVAVVVIAVVVGLALWFTGRIGADPQDDPTTPTATSTTDETGGRVANGCLGGQAVNAQTVLTAQQQAPLDDVGAAELAATFFRWGGVSGETLPPIEEIDTVIDAIATPDADPDITDVREQIESHGAGSQTERTGPAVSTVEGGYYIESSDEGGVVVSVLLIVPEYPRDDGTTEPRAFSTTVTMQRTDVWRIQSLDATRTTDDLASIMTPFVGGC